MHRVKADTHKGQSWRLGSVSAPYRLTPLHGDEHIEPPTLLTTTCSSNLITGMGEDRLSFRRMAVGLGKPVKSCGPNSFPKREIRCNASASWHWGSGRVMLTICLCKCHCVQGHALSRGRSSQSLPTKPRPVPLVPGGAARLRCRPKA